MAIWKKSKYRGVRFREHATRKYNRQSDKYYAIWYWNKALKKTVTESIGWMSEGWSDDEANEILTTIKKNIKLGVSPQSVEEMRQMKEAEDRAEAERAKQEELENVTFGEAAEHYLEWSKNNKKSYKADRYRYDKHLGKRFADGPMKSISPFDLEKLKSALKKKRLTPATIGQVLQLIRAVYRKAIEWGLYRGEIPKMSFPKIANRRVAFLSVEQTHQLLNRLKEKSFQLWCQSVLSVYAGLRFSEIAKLEKQDINPESGTVHIRDPKSGYDRHVYTTKPIQQMFDELWAENGKQIGLVFPDMTGKRQNRVSPTFARTVKELGFNKDATDDRQKIVFHTLRHTFGSHLAMAGESLQTIQELMGHRSIETTMRYAHLMPDIKWKAAHNLADIFKRDKVIDLVETKKDKV